jgi:environmental stress-induced protein Ves
MSCSFVRLDEVTPAPWRNGGGVTRELLAWPGPDHWSIRISVADIERDGPFSPFPGVERWFAVLAGGGVRLTIDGDASPLTVRDQPVRFDGGAATTCQLLAGATQDFNLMLHGASGHVQRLSGSHAATCRAGTFVAVYSHLGDTTVRCAARQSDVPPKTLAWRILRSDGLIELIGEDALWMEIAP